MSHLDDLHSLACDLSVTFAHREAFRTSLLDEPKRSEILKRQDIFRSCALLMRIVTDHWTDLETALRRVKEMQQIAGGVGYHLDGLKDMIEEEDEDWKP